MQYESQINRLILRLDEANQQHLLVRMVDREISKSTFHYQVRQFVTSLIRQRQLIVNKGASRKSNSRMLAIIDRLRANLDACPGKDVSSAGFFLRFEEDILAIIPGSFPSKRHTTFFRLRNQAREIKNQNS